MKNVNGPADAFLAVASGVKPAILIVGDPVE
jgi:hypothetical protein